MTEVQQRREALNMNISELAREAGVNRDTLSDLETGTASPQTKTMGKITEALDRLETEAGLDAPKILDPAERIVEFAVEGYDGVRVIVKGSIIDVVELRKQAALLIETLPRPE